MEGKYIFGHPICTVNKLSNKKIFAFYLKCNYIYIDFIKIGEYMKLSNLKVGSKVSQVHAVAEQVALIYEKAMSETELFTADGNLATIFTALNAKKANMTEAIEHSKAESDLEERDGERDFIIQGIASAIQSSAFSFDPDVKSANYTLSPIFGKYGLAMIGKAYDIESSLIKAFLQDVSTEQATNAIAVIPYLSDLIERLKNAQEAFDEAQTVWSKAKSTDCESATAIKKQLLDIINDQLVNYLTVMATINPSYEALAKHIDEVIDTTNRNVVRK